MSDDLRDKLVEALAAIAEDGPRHDDRYVLAGQDADHLMPIIKQHYAEPPPGWAERVEAEYSPWEGVWWNISAAWVMDHWRPGDRPCRTRRVWVGPWEER